MVPIKRLNIMLVFILFVSKLLSGIQLFLGFPPTQTPWTQIVISNFVGFPRVNSGKYKPYPFYVKEKKRFPRLLGIPSSLIHLPFWRTDSIIISSTFAVQNGRDHEPSTKHLSTAKNRQPDRPGK